MNKPLECFQRSGHWPDNWSNDWDLLHRTSLWEIGELFEREQLLCCSNLTQLKKEVRASGLSCAKVEMQQKILPCYDSRQLQNQQIFVALIGENFDGHDFIHQAVDFGVLAIVYQVQLERELQQQMGQLGIVAFQVKSSRQALALLSAHCFGYPSQKMQVLGITGTDGKTSIAYFCYQILSDLENENTPVGLLSTFGLDFGLGLEPNPLHQTTPESLLVQRALARMLANGCRFAVLECSSHGLSPLTARLMYVEFSGALFSNLSPEHLEFHGSMECYAQDKARLFSRIKVGGIAVWNILESASELLYHNSGARKDLQHWGYAAKPFADSAVLLDNCKIGLERPSCIPFRQILQAKNFQLGVRGSRFELELARWKDYVKMATYHCAIHIPGSVYISNAVGALSLCYAMLENELQVQLQADGICNLGQILQSLSPKDALEEPYFLALRAPKGRMELVDSQAPFTVLVDYAHSPGSFSRLLPEMKALLPQSKRLLILFGSAGQRDRQKRFLQGQLAARYANVIVLCNEDPREENEMAILTDIRAGVLQMDKTDKTNSTDLNFDFILGQNLFLIPDRRQAMQQLFALARQGDLVLLLGKGHETSMIFSGQRQEPWDEQEVALALLQQYLC